MPTRTEARPWDFSQVHDLVNSLSSKDASLGDWQHDEQLIGSPQYDLTPKAAHTEAQIAAKDFGTPATKLGDFAKIWQYLGTPADSPVPEVPPLTSEPLGAENIPAKTDYTSDGATYFKAAKGGKVVSWQDEASVEEPGTDTVTDRSASPDTPTLTKTQRKKQRRKERRAKEAAEALKSATVSESEADIVARRTPARKASAHVVPASDAYSRYNLRERNASRNTIATPTTPTPAPSSTDTVRPSVELATSRVAEMLAKMKQADPQTPSKTRPPPPSTPRHNHDISGENKRANPVFSASTQPTARACDALHTRPAQQWPAATSSDAQAMQFVPSTVQPPQHTAAHSITTQPKPSLALSQNTPPSTKPKNIIEPKIVRSGEDRHWALLMKLIADYWQDRAHLIAPMNLTTHNNSPTGIHVFVDASNIFIGFTDQLKRSRNIPQRVHVPPVNLSFDALALLMERRRPVAKRVLVGSTPHLPAFDKAKAVGYECNILEKVMKARELTERQIYFKERERLGHGRQAAHGQAGAKAPPANHVLPVTNSATTNGYHSSTGSVGGGGSGSETTAPPQYAPARMIEQGVDEILHLKILESIVDTDVPSTIVLATGDAAQAEYSQGFMAMVERALKKGWKVELVSWSRNVSMMYSRREWVEQWGDAFRVVGLDDYAEELLEM